MDPQLDGTNENNALNTIEFKVPNVSSVQITK